MNLKLEADVLILAAGFGKRLRPLTEHTPKPLVEVSGRALIEWNFDHIKKAGFKRVFVNTHYLKEKVFAYFSERKSDSLEIEVISESPDILDTGGAILNIKDKLRHPYLLTINGDAMFDDSLDLRGMLNYHANHSKKPVATMLLRDSEDKKDYGLIGLSKNQQVISFLGQSFFEQDVVSELMYTGVQILSREIFNFMPEEKGTAFGITRSTYPRALEAKSYIGSQIYSGYFNDVGTPERLAEVRSYKS